MFNKRWKRVLQLIYENTTLKNIDFAQNPKVGKIPKIVQFILYLSKSPP